MPGNVPPVERSLTCNYPAWGAKDCGGHGKCVEGYCHCDDGFTGHGDWHDLEGIDCQMSTVAIRILWVLPLVFTCLNLKWHIPLLIETFKAPEVKGNFKKLLEKPAGRFNAVVSVWGIGIFVVALCKIIDPLNRTISPTDPGPWNIFCFGTTLFYWGVTIFNKMQIKLALKGMGAKGDAKMVKLNQTVNMLNPKAALDTFVLVSAVILGNIGNGINSSKLMTISYLIFNGWRFLTMLLTLWQVITMKISINKAFEGIGDNVKAGEVLDAGTQKIVKLKQTMQHFVNDAFKAVFSNGSLTLLFVCYQGVWSKWGYFLPIQQLIATAIVFGMKGIFVKEANKKKAGGTKVAAGLTGTTTVLTTTTSTTSSVGPSTSSNAHD